MKRRKNILLPLTAFALLATSCSMMQDDRSNCPECSNPLRVKLKYDYNMQRSDMFYDHVGAATCYVVDADNRVVAAQTAQNTADAQPLKDYSFGFNFEGLAAGEYRIVSVGAQRPFSELTRFTADVLSEGDDIRQLRLRIPVATATDSNGRHAVDHGAPLDTLWHGMTTTPVVVSADSPTEATVSLTRDMNNLSLTLIQSNNPTDNDASLYDVRIVDDNVLYDYDNAIIEGTPVVYQPYAAWTTEATTNDTRADGDKVVQRVAHYDLSVGRIVSRADASKNMRLQITNRADDRRIVDIDLAYYLAMARNASAQSYSIQEFLDREYDFHLDFFLEGNEWRYMTLSISLTNWSIRIQNSTL